MLIKTTQDLVATYIIQPAVVLGRINPNPTEVPSIGRKKTHRTDKIPIII
jgi:hypothetical protein